LLIIDRNPWKLTLFRASSNGALEAAGISDEDQPNAIASSVLLVEFKFNAADAAIDIFDDSGDLIRSVATKV